MYSKTPGFLNHACSRFHEHCFDGELRGDACICFQRCSCSPYLLDCIAYESLFFSKDKRVIVSRLLVLYRYRRVPMFACIPKIISKLLLAKTVSSLVGVTQLRPDLEASSERGKIIKCHRCKKTDIVVERKRWAVLDKFLDF